MFIFSVLHPSKMGASHANKGHVLAVHITKELPAVSLAGANRSHVHHMFTNIVYNNTSRLPFCQCRLAWLGVFLVFVVQAYAHNGNH